MHNHVCLHHPETPGGSWQINGTMPLLVTPILTNPLPVAKSRRSMAMLVHGCWALLHHTMHSDGMERESVSDYSSAHYHDQLLNIAHMRAGTARCETDGWMSDLLSVDAISLVIDIIYTHHFYCHHD